jgi:imidazolonepropionase-like amidohydrolase
MSKAPMNDRGRRAGAVMMQLLGLFVLGGLASAIASRGLMAQDMVITNARVIVGNGQVIEKGSVVVQGGRIVSVSAGAPSGVARGVQRIDASGMTIMPGFIDDHRHLIGRPDTFFQERAVTEMRELLEAGYTTVQAGGDAWPAIFQLKQKIESGEIKGPRIIASEQVPTDRLPNEDAVRAAVDRAVKDGADSIAEVHFPVKAFPAMPTEQESKNLAAGIAEAKKLNVEFQVHAVSPEAMLAAVHVGATRLVHTPHFGWLTDADAKEVKDAGALVSSCTGFGAPVFGVFNQDNKPTFRDGKPWPEGILDGQGRGREAGYKPVNGRTLFDNGVVYGYCTDTTYNATAGLAQELKVLNLVFSPIDIIQIMGPNSAAFIDRSKDIGTLEPGKLADIVVLAGNPLDGYWNLLTAKVVIKGGVIMVDKRGKN